MAYLRVIAYILIFCLLTILTQVGGFVYLLSLLIHQWTNKWTTNKILQASLNFASFLVLYCLTSFAIVPLIAKPLGRVPLPMCKENNLRPLNILTCLLNRNYVKPTLRQTIFEVANQMHAAYPGTTTNYLDANFPFIDKFPLLPHLSHNDGKKLDLTFCYRDRKTGLSTNRCPSFIGYGIVEDPLPNEINTAKTCSNNGYWQYSFLTKMVPQTNKANFVLDNEKTRALIYNLINQPKVEKIFIEPHLVKRLNLNDDKIRFQGCHSVRHDDHIHVQIK